LSSSPCLGFQTEAHKRPQYIVDGFVPLNDQVSCHYVHFTSIEDIYLKSSIPGQNSILRVTGRTAQADYPEIMANVSLRLRVKIGKAMVIRSAGKSFFFETTKQF